MKNKKNAYRQMPVSHKNKHSKKKIHLGDILNQIYYGTFNLDTTCNHTCLCCKVAMPGFNYSEAVQILQVLWDKLEKNEKVELICKSIEYYLKNDYDKFGTDTLIKPCLLLSDKGLCGIYENRPLNCRLFGLWPKSMYENRVNKFAKAYEGKLQRHELPLNTQCPNVKRLNNDVEITEENINSVYKLLDDLDGSLGNFTSIQIEQKENYRTLHDWVLYFFFGEEWLSGMTKFMIGGSKDEITDLIEKLKIEIRKTFENSIPNLKI